MIRKHMLFRLLLACLALGIPVMASADYAAYDITMQPGSSEVELNFTWLTTSELTGNEELLIGTDSYIATCSVAEEADTEGEESTDIFSCQVSSVAVEKSTSYSYRIGDGVDYTDAVSVETQDAQNYNFIFVGDPQIGSSGETEDDAKGWATTVTTALTAFPDTSFIMSAGDQVNTANSSSEYDGFFTAAELATTPFAPAIGNHDEDDLYSSHFNIPNVSADYGTSEQYSGGDYWFSYGDTLFMVLNTNIDDNSTHETFIEETIAANPDARWKVLVYHHSIFSSASHVADVNGTRTALYPIIDENDIDVVLSGHDHFYARTYQLSGGEIVEDGASYSSFDRRTQSDITAYVDLVDEAVVEVDSKTVGRTVVVDPEGTVYFTANSASGSKYYDFNEIDGYTNYYFAMYEQLKTPTYLNIDVDNYSLTVSAYRTDTGEQLDSYTIVKSREGRHSYE